MRKAIYVAILLVALAVPVYASSFGDVITGSGTFGLKVQNQLIDGRAIWGLASASRKPRPERECGVLLLRQLV
jgi:hypothetical protein